MPNLVGIGLSQVPTNSMLGGLAYQDPEHASIKNLDLKNLSQINSEIADTAVDVFIYDTSKDSDGGAWRKRTQDTSWYNETLGTATRGTRKEFPAVAVIVAETTKVTIYDGDDPDLPMWMVFNVSNTTWFKLYSSGSQCSCVTAFNATLCAGGNGAGIRLAVVDFIKDNQYLTEAGYTYYQANGIVTRNDTTTHTNDGGSKSIVNNVVNDVAMTVLPNAPIDIGTGLSVPTIAVATSGGISVIRDDGSVYDLTTSDVYDNYSKVEFGDNNRLYYTGNNTQVLYSRAIPTADQNYTAYNTTNTNRVMFPSMDHGGFLTNHPVKLLGTNGNTPYVIAKNKASGSKETSYAPSDFGIRPGLTFIDAGETNPTSSVAYATTSYNTGWMHGDIKGAFLSDTDTTNLVATDLDIVTNGNFAADSDWTKGTGWTISGGTATHTGSGGDIKQQIAVVTGRRYLMAVTVDLTGDTSIANTTLGFRTLANDGYYVYKSNWTANAVNSIGLYWTSTVTGNILARCYSSDDVSLDNWVVQDVTDGNSDRSANINGLQVFGTITKTPVATGADLVAYHGVSASNYLKQPYNSDLDFGTGDFSILVWVLKNTLSTNHYIMDRASVPFSSSGRTYFIIQASGYHRFRLGGGNEVTGNVTAMQPGVYNQVGFVRRNGQMEFYLNGELVQTVTGSNASASFHAGGSRQEMVVDRFQNGFSQDYTFDRMALFRISGSAPSTEQIKKMYDDEKHLFQENAKATLYGSSDAVTALAYDEVTDQLHVGTSAGRSDFQGLRRINNTTTAVTTAISAHDEFIIEQ